MEWNDGKERSKFEREQRQLRKQYLAAGMSEEQIKEAYEFDLEWYKSRRREAAHTQKLDVDTGDDECLDLLLSKYIENFSVNDEYFTSSRYGWIETITNINFIKALNCLTADELELITKLIVDELSQQEIAELLCISQQAISKKIKKIKKIFEKWL
jgi:RNA polymerase sigma factor (sigma-70 family)